MKTEQPLWGRGQMVSPQHFQQQFAYAAWSAECIAQLGLSHPWGVINATFEPGAMKLDCLQARHIHIRFQDGTLIDTNNADALPPALSLADATHDVVVVLALPLLRANGGNCLKPDEVAERPVRYRQRWRDVRNTFGDDTRQIAVMQPELTLRFAHQNNNDYLTCPIVRLQKDSQGTWLLDETFLPPLLTIQGSRWLVTQLEQLMMQLRARLTRLMAMRRESNERMADFAVADVSLFWLLNALNSAEPVLGQFQTVIYRPLAENAMRTIVQMKLAQVSKRLHRHYGLTTHINKSLYDALTAACLLPDTGARNVDSLLNQQILPVLSQQLLTYMAAKQKPQSLTLEWNEEEGIGLSFDRIQGVNA